MLLGCLAKGGKDDSPISSDGDRRKRKKGGKQRSPSPEPQRKKHKGTKGRPSTPAAVKKKSSKDEEMEDPTKDMEDPVVVPKVEEVMLPTKQVSYFCLDGVMPFFEIVNLLILRMELPEF